MQDKYLSIIHLNNYHSKKLINLFKILILPNGLNWMQTVKSSLKASVGPKLVQLCKKRIKGIYHQCN